MKTKLEQICTKEYKKGNPEVKIAILRILEEVRKEIDKVNPKSDGKTKRI